jgi:hypothetical protein
MEARNRLAALLNDPSSFENDPSYQFARDQGLSATARSNSAQRGSGNALAALARYGSGLATQGYNQRVDSLGRIAGQDQQYDLGQQQNANTRIRNANDFTLGQAQNENTRTRNANDFTMGTQRNQFDYSLGSQRNANDFTMGTQRNQFDYSLGSQRNANDFTIGTQRNQNDRENNLFNYDLGMGSNYNQFLNNQNQYNLGLQRNATDAYGAQTQRGSTNANNYFNQQRNALSFMGRT